ncbi:hypothetical protein CLV28_0960 [Sediminihabitans luteus]|uniref:Uncharacterized protein n=1 Tax=Sediminihabitans luteus TaxID=1138585 RepID=A0A2M9D0K9_9CELL|nr:hypothetical protein [Sediminihabitans luteus]PJJ77734.1 hypothetical protein CLV28_0960 [Sediminihabitans luteus]GIJ00039.1 hypothetical protein Slu03_24160 [Sediminihabitans luteus]
MGTNDTGSGGADGTSGADGTGAGPPTRCRACGWDLGEPPWTAQGPTRTICDCCGAESGVDDVPVERARDYRRRWIERGAEWFDPEVRPADWDLYDQLTRLGPA